MLLAESNDQPGGCTEIEEIVAAKSATDLTDATDCDGSIRKNL
jgi:hypothetical protein